MLKKFNAVYGQSNFDVCLNTYGSLDNLYKLLKDSGVDGINSTPASNQQFTYDDDLLVNGGVTQNFELNGIKYATDIGINGSVYYIIKQKQPPGIKPPPIIDVPPIPPTDMKEIASTSYLSNADGTTIITPTDKDGLSMVGYTLIFIEKETKPLINAQWNWNRSLGILTLLGTTLDDTQTLFILYAKTV